MTSFFVVVYFRVAGDDRENLFLIINFKFIFQSSTVLALFCLHDFVIYHTLASILMK